jgi:hypothetical protein
LSVASSNMSSPRMNRRAPAPRVVPDTGATRVQEEEPMKEVPVSVDPDIDESTVPKERTKIADHFVLMQYEYEMIHDSKGNKPFEITSSSSSSIPVNQELEAKDTFNLNTVYFQFLGCTGTTLKNCIFSFQFFQWPFFWSEKLLVEDPQKIPGAISPFVRVEEATGAFADKKGMIARFSGAGPEFVRYMLERNMVVEVWDALGMFKVGNIEIDLKLLLRQQKSAIQITKEYDIVPEVCCVKL